MQKYPANLQVMSEFGLPDDIVEMISIEYAKTADLLEFVIENWEFGIQFRDLSNENILYFARVRKFNLIEATARKTRINIPNLIDHITNFEYAMKFRKLGYDCSVVAVENFARQGNLNAVRWIFENHVLTPPQIICNEQVYKNAAASGNIQLVRYIYENISSYLYPSSVFEAIKNGNLEIFRFLSPHFPIFSEIFALHAIRRNQFWIFHFIITNNQVLYKCLTVEILIYDRVDFLRLLYCYYEYDNVLNYAITKNANKCLEYITKVFDHEITPDDVNNAAYKNNIQALEILLSKNPAVDKTNVIRILASSGNVSQIKYLQEKYSLDPSSGIAAALMSGSVETYEYLISRLVNITPETYVTYHVLNTIIRENKLDMLKYIRQNVLPDQTFYKIIPPINLNFCMNYCFEKDYSEMFYYLADELQTPITHDTVIAAIKKRRTDLITKFYHGNQLSDFAKDSAKAYLKMMRKL